GDGVTLGRSEKVGYAPHAAQRVSLGDEFQQSPGRIIIMHAPEAIPIRPASFEIELRAMAISDYSVVVTANTAASAAVVLAKRLEEAKSKQLEIENCSGDAEMLWQILQLQERKFV
ncbi:unnamed protein product, partial [Chrysoparadoxa australica]